MNFEMSAIRENMGEMNVARTLSAKSANTLKSFMKVSLPRCDVHVALLDIVLLKGLCHGFLAFL